MSYPNLRHRRLRGVRRRAGLGLRRPPAADPPRTAQRAPARAARSARRARREDRSRVQPMNPVRRRRLLLDRRAGRRRRRRRRAGRAARCSATSAYLYTPSEVLRGRSAGGAARFRLGGMVADGIVQRAQRLAGGALRASPTAMPRCPCVYTGILPDLFREKQAVVATGRMRGRHVRRRARCSPSTTRPTCRRKSPTRWAWRTRSTTCRRRDGAPASRESASQ